MDDLLDVARLQSGKVQVRPERLDLARLARTAAEDFRPVVDRAGRGRRGPGPGSPPKGEPEDN